MKTLKAAQLQKVVTWSLVVMFAFLQIVPTGWAANAPVEELRARSVSASKDAFTNQADSFKVVIPQGAHEAFFSSGPLKAVENPKKDEKLEAAREILGGRVAYGVVQPPQAKDNSVATNFYDKKGRLIGTHVVIHLEDVTDHWYKADRDGNLTEIEPKSHEGKAVQDPIVPRTPEELAAMAEAKEAYAVEHPDGEQVAVSPVKIAEKDLPRQVQNVVSRLTTAFGSAYGITVSYPKCLEGEKCGGFYIITMTYLPKVLRLGQLRSVSIAVLKDGTLKGVDDVRFDGIETTVDGQLLYEGMLTLIRTTGVHHKYLPDSEYGALLISEIKIRKVEDGAIYFEQGNYVWKVYRNLDGKVTLEKGLPVPVQNYVDEFENGGFAVKVSVIKTIPPSYAITATYQPKVLRTGMLRSISFTLGADGKFQHVTAASFDGVGEVEAALLYEALQKALWTINSPTGVKPLPLLDPVDPGVKDSIPIINIISKAGKTIDSILILMIQTKVRSYEDGVISFEHDGFVWKAYRNQEGQVIVEKGPTVAVQNYMDTLGQQFRVCRLDVCFNHYAVTAILQKDGTYLVSFYSKIKMATIGRMGTASFILDGKGNLMSGSVTASYIERPGVDGNLLWEGLKQLAVKNGVPVDIQAFALMANIAINKLDVNGAIYLDYNGMGYKIYRDQSGIGRLQQVS